MSVWRYVLWMLSPVISVYMVLVTAFYSLVVIIATYISGRELVDSLVAQWSRHLLWLADAHVEVSGLENIPDEGVLYFFNHTSFFDILVTHACIPRSFRYGAKIELFKIPFFGAAMRRAEALPIARHDRASVLKVYEKAVARVRNGESFFLAPEGTRQSEPEIGPFKSGPFIFAINAQAPIVPVVLVGVNEIMRKGSLLVNYKKPHKVSMHILKPVSTKGVTLSEREGLKEKVRDQIVSRFKELSNQRQS